MAREKVPNCRITNLKLLSRQIIGGIYNYRHVYALSS